MCAGKEGYVCLSSKLRRHSPGHMVVSLNTEQPSIVSPLVTQPLMVSGKERELNLAQLRHTPEVHASLSALQPLKLLHPASGHGMKGRAYLRDEPGAGWSSWRLYSLQVLRVDFRIVTEMQQKQTGMS